ESEERFRLVVESAPNGIVMVDQDGLIVLVNREAERAFGYRREELLGAPVEVLLPAALREQHVMHRRTFWSQPVARRMGMGRDLAGWHKDGSAFPIEVGLAPIEMTQGTGVLATVIDITQRKQAEDKVHVAQARLQAALAGGGMATWLLDIPQGQIEWDEAAL